MDAGRIHCTGRSVAWGRLVQCPENLPRPGPATITPLTATAHQHRPADGASERRPLHVIYLLDHFSRKPLFSPCSGGLGSLHFQHHHTQFGSSQITNPGERILAWWSLTCSSSEGIHPGPVALASSAGDRLLPPGEDAHGGMMPVFHAANPVWQGWNAASTPSGRGAWNAVCLMQLLVPIRVPQDGLGSSPAGWTFCACSIALPR